MILDYLASHEPQLLEPPGADPHARWCGRGSVRYTDRPYPDIILVTPRSIDSDTSDEEASDSFERGNVFQVVLLLGAMVLFALALRPLGFILATTSFLVGCGFVLGERKFHIMIPISAFSAFGIWYLVQEVLGIFMRPWPGIGV